MTPEDLLPLLYRALESPGGVLAKTNDPNAAKQMLYRALRKFGPGPLDQLRFTTVDAEDGNLKIARPLKGDQNG